MADRREFLKALAGVFAVPAVMIPATAPITMVLEDVSDYIMVPSAPYFCEMVLAPRATCTDCLQVQPHTDFQWESITLCSDGDCEVSFTDSKLNRLTSGMLMGGLFQSGFPLYPAVVIPAGGYIGVCVRNLTGELNGIRIGFDGCDRYAK